MTLETTPPAVNLLSREARQNIDGLAHSFKLFILRQLPCLLVVITVPRYVMSSRVNGFDSIGVAFRQGTAGNKSCLILFLAKKRQILQYPTCGPEFRLAH